MQPPDSEEFWVLREGIPSIRVWTARQRTGQRQILTRETSWHCTVPSPWVEVSVAQAPGILHKVSGDSGVWGWWGGAPSFSRNGRHYRAYKFNEARKIVKAWSQLYWGFPAGTVVKNMPASIRDVKDVGSIPGSGRSPGGGHGNPLQDSFFFFICLGKFMDRGAWWAI